MADTDYVKVVISQEGILSDSLKVGKYNTNRKNRGNFQQNREQSEFLHCYYHCYLLK